MAQNVLVNRPAVEADLAMLDAGGDFAEGVISYQGSWLAAEAFVSFDKKATTLSAAQSGPFACSHKRSLAEARQVKAKARRTPR
jgi:hypothetical protein